MDTLGILTRRNSAAGQKAGFESREIPGVRPAHQEGSGATDGAALPAVQLDRLQLFGDRVVVVAET